MSSRPGDLPIVPTEVVDQRTVGLWQPDSPMSDEDFVGAGHHLFDGSFCWPAMVLRRSAVEHNIATLSDFCSRHGLAFAPHGKTTMSPALFSKQLDAGAWGITVATANQLLAAWSFGLDQVLLANELVDPPRLAWVARELQVNPDRRILFYVDSLAGVEIADAAIRDQVTTRRVPVLLEVGHSGGRTGARDRDSVFAVARAVAESPVLELAGVAAYEGGLHELADVESYLGQLQQDIVLLARDGLLGANPIVTAGGSAWFDVIAKILGGTWSNGLEPLVVLRSGAYISHDDGIYSTKTPFNRISAEGSLIAALEVWAQVTSRSEPSLAIVAMGKREVPYDEGLPVTRAIRRRGSERLEGLPRIQIAATNDHHAYLPVPEDVEISVGDLICFGVSHPCTAFDKWRAIALLEDDDSVSGVVRTYF